MGRAPCCDKANVKKGPWSPEEDTKLKEYIEKHGTGGNWIALPHKAGLRRCGKSCRLRWLNYLRPNIKHGEFSDEEDRIICSLFASIGSRWSVIAAQLPGRTDNDIKNYWNTKLKKKLFGRHKDQLLHQEQKNCSNIRFPLQIGNGSSSLLTSIHQADHLTSSYLFPQISCKSDQSSSILSFENLSNYPPPMMMNFHHHHEDHDHQHLDREEQQSGLILGDDGSSVLDHDHMSDLYSMRSSSSTDHGMLQPFTIDHHHSSAAPFSSSTSCFSFGTTSGHDQDNHPLILSSTSNSSSNGSFPQILPAAAAGLLLKSSTSTTTTDDHHHDQGLIMPAVLDTVNDHDQVLGGGMDHNLHFQVPKGILDQNQKYYSYKYLLNGGASNFEGETGFWGNSSTSTVFPSSDYEESKPVISHSSTDQFSNFFVNTDICTNNVNSSSSMY